MRPTPVATGLRAAWIIWALVIIQSSHSTFICKDTKLFRYGQPTGFKLCDDLIVDREQPHVASDNSDATAIADDDDGADVAVPPQMHSCGSVELKRDGAASFSFRHIQRSFYNVSGNQKHKVSGSLITLESDVLSHFSVVQPAFGCGNNVGATVQQTATQYQKVLVTEALLACTGNRSHCEPWVIKPSEELSLRQRVHVSSIVQGCRVATNAGLYDTDTFSCHGSLVQDGRFIQGDARRAAQFGIYRAADCSTRALVGYLHENDTVIGAEQWVSGLGWLVRSGANFVSTGIPMYAEDPSLQESGSMHRFFTIASGRRFVGINKAGKLVIAHVDGRSDWLGLDTRTLADFAVQIGMHAAINLDGGASVTLVRDGVVANTPSYSCMQPDAMWEDAVAAEESRVLKEADRPAVGDDPNFRCQRPVSSILCIHDAPMPPRISASGIIRVSRGCVCFPSVEKHGDEGFALAEVAGLVQFDGVKPSRRLSEDVFKHQRVDNCLCNVVPTPATTSTTLRHSVSNNSSEEQANSVWQLFVLTRNKPSQTDDPSPTTSYAISGPLQPFIECLSNDTSVKTPCFTRAPLQPQENVIPIADSVVQLTSAITWKPLVAVTLIAVSLLAINLSW